METQIASAALAVGLCRGGSALRTLLWLKAASLGKSASSCVQPTFSTWPGQQGLTRNPTHEPIPFAGRRIVTGHDAQEYPW
jgi:hypothetical protein